MAQAMVNFRMDEELKKNMEETCKDLGLSMNKFDFKRKKQ